MKEEKRGRWRKGSRVEEENTPGRESRPRTRSLSLSLAPAPPLPPVLFLLAPFQKMKSALLARSGAPSFAAQRRVVRPRAVAARAEIKAPQVIIARSREQSFPASLLFFVSADDDTRAFSSFSACPEAFPALHSSTSAAETPLRDVIHGHMRREGPKTCRKGPGLASSRSISSRR